MFWLEPLRILIGFNTTETVGFSVQGLFLDLLRMIINLLDRAPGCFVEVSEILPGVFLKKPIKHQNVDHATFPANLLLMVKTFD